MKKLTGKKRTYWPKLSDDRFRRALKRNKKTLKSHSLNQKTKNEVSVIAPAILDMYTPKHHTSFIAFKNEMDKQAEIAYASEKPLRICFRNTTHITAAAGLLLVATVDNIINTYDNIRFRVTRPPATTTQDSKNHIHLVDSVLAHIGFYKLIGHGHIQRPCNTKSVTCWKYAYGDDASGEIAAQLLENLSSYGIKTNKLYRSCFEAVANACEHAYTDKIESPKPFSIERWWFFVGVLNDKITVLICDLGHGIPKTLEVTQEEGLLSKIWSKLNLTSKPSEECTLIRASTMVKETRTKEVYRGKGGADVKTFVDQTENSSLVIFSNRGTYRYKGENKPSRAYDNTLSIGGTIVEWTIPYVNANKS
ncbi:hypothetical protein ACQKP8_24260 [Photobacterium alginatilyticum]|uniref:hypothetical protein n=1 Tax=Photobacterium alginatilyticum TaxID=1775171 RepID=UPI00406975CC